MKIHCMSLGSFEANCYTVTDEEYKKAFIIDPGAESEKITEYIASTGCKPEYIIITHAHADHIGALDEIKRKFDAKVVIHKKDAAPLNNDVWNLCKNFGFPSPQTKVDIAVNDGDCLPFGKSKIKFIHTPGHTKGSMCILYENVLFSGDTLFRQSIGRTDFIGGNFDDIINSIKNKIFTLDEKTAVYPGHGAPTDILYEKGNNPFC